MSYHLLARLDQQLPVCPWLQPKSERVVGVLALGASVLLAFSRRIRGRRLTAGAIGFSAAVLFVDGFRSRQHPLFTWLPRSGPGLNQLCQGESGAHLRNWLCVWKGGYRGACVLGTGLGGTHKHVYRATTKQGHPVVVAWPHRKIDKGRAKTEFLLEKQVLEGYPACRYIIRGCYFQGTKNPYLVLESCEAMAMGKPQPAQFWLYLVEALRKIHASGYIHGDLKLGNVLVKDGEPRLIDFGTLMKKGTPVPKTPFATYEAPEVGHSRDARRKSGKVGWVKKIQGTEHPLDEKQDVWGLGIAIAESLGISMNHLAYDPVYTNQARISTFSGICGEEVLNQKAKKMKPLLEGALQPNPEDRWTLAQVEAELRRLARSEDLAGGSSKVKGGLG